MKQPGTAYDDGGPGGDGGGVERACDRCSEAAPCLPAWSKRSPWRSSCHSPTALGLRHHLWNRAKKGGMTEVGDGEWELILQDSRIH